jgi:Xaa-Pro aminopeptidase
MGAGYKMATSWLQTQSKGRRMSEIFPTIPHVEFPRRWTAVQEQMARRDLDLLVAYADDRAVFGPAHARWLADFPVHFEPCCVVLAQHGEPILLCGPESDQYALTRSRIRDVRVLREFTHPDEDYPFSHIEGLEQVVKGLGVDAQRVGLAGRSLMGWDVLDAFRRALPDAEWSDAEGLLMGLRAVKSEAEIAVTRKAYEIAQIGMDAAVAVIRVGVSERAVAAEAESAMRRAGAEGTGIDTIVAAGPNTRPILARSTLRAIGAGELVLLTVAPHYEGYHAAIGRPVLVGQVGAEVEAAAEAAQRAQEACRAALRPGVEGRAVEAVGRRVMEEAGLGDYFLYSGVHSVGVIEFEPPIFGPSSAARLQAGMVISVAIPVFNAPWGGLRVEDGYLMTERGCERLSGGPHLFRV